MRYAVVFVAALLTSVAQAGEAKKKPSLVAQPHAFPTLVNPDCSHCVDEAKRRADLKDDDRVLCWIRGYSDGGAIPFRFFLNKYPVISDTYGVFVHDPAAGYARGFAPSLDFAFHGWRNGVMVMKHKDGTLYSCLSGKALDGPKKGSRLTPVPTLVSDWGFWLKHYPHAVAYKMYDKYQPEKVITKFGTWSLLSQGPIDARLQANVTILGVRAENQARAYPLDAIANSGLLTDELDGKPCVIFWCAATKTAAAYRPIASAPKKGEGDPKSLTIKRDDKNKSTAFVDLQTGSRWNITGRAVAGPLKGWTLEWMDGTQVYWPAWAAEYPETTIYGRK